MGEAFTEDNCRKQYLYHVTERGNLPSILREGLIPRVGERTRDAMESLKEEFGLEVPPAVYLWDKERDARWMKELFEKEEGKDMVILGVECRCLGRLGLTYPEDIEAQIVFYYGREILRELGELPESEPSKLWEFAVRKPIPPECLKVLED